MRKLWCKIELEKEMHAQLSDYFIEDGNTALCKDETDERCQDVGDESTLVKLESGGEGATATIGSSESRALRRVPHMRGAGGTVILKRKASRLLTKR